MGACISIPSGHDVSEQDRQRHRDAEKQLKEVCLNLAIVMSYPTHTLTPPIGKN